MKKIAIITARGGSKRIPRKNINLFLGKPILAYGIEVALNSKLFDEVMVSTDDHEVASIAKKYGAKVPFLRSEKNSDDYSTTADVISEVLEEYKAIGCNFDYAICIYPTAVFLSVEHINKGFQLLQKNEYDIVFPVMQFGFPIQRAVRLTPERRAQMVMPENLKTRSQDLEPRYHDCGQFYWLKVSSFLTKQEILTDNSGVLLLSEMEAHDIDTPEDWEIAEFKYQLMLNKNK